MGYLVGAIVILVINVIIASHMQDVAYAKGYDKEASAFAMSFWLGIAGWIYVLALPDMVERKNQEKIIELLQNQTSQNVGRLPEL